MVRKLYKHELLSLLRLTVPVGIACLVAAVIMKIGELIFPNKDESVTIDIAGGALSVVVFMLIAALFIITVWTVIKRFHVSMYSSEGYLTHTIPVSTSTTLICKLVCGVIVILLSYIMVSVTLGIMMFPIEEIRLSEIFSAFGGSGDLSWSEIGKELLYAAVLWGYGLSGLTSSIAMVFLAITLGHLAKKRKIGMSVVWYIAISTLSNTFDSILRIVFDKLGLEYYGGGVSFILDSVIPMFEESIVAYVNVSLIYVLYVVVCILISTYVVKNKLNLE